MGNMADADTLDRDSFPIKSGLIGGGANVPPFGLCRPSGFDAATNAVVVIPPDKDHDNSAIVNGALSVEPGQFGTGYLSGRVTVAYDPADGVPQPGELWGVKAGFSVLKKGYGGFAVLTAGQTDGPVNCRRLTASREPFVSRLTSEAAGRWNRVPLAMTGGSPVLADNGPDSTGNPAVRVPTGTTFLNPVATGDKVLTFPDPAGTFEDFLPLLDPREAQTAHVSTSHIYLSTWTGSAWVDSTTDVAAVLAQTPISFPASYWIVYPSRDRTHYEGIPLQYASATISGGGVASGFTFGFVGAVAQYWTGDKWLIEADARAYTATSVSGSAIGWAGIGFAFPMPGPGLMIRGGSADLTDPASETPAYWIAADPSGNLFAQTGNMFMANYVAPVPPVPGPAVAEAGGFGLFGFGRGHTGPVGGIMFRSGLCFGGTLLIDGGTW